MPKLHLREVIVIGGGLAGLACAMRLAENGLFVKLVTLSPARRSHSVCAQGGINAALNVKGEGDSPYIHAYDTLKGGDFLADQPPVLEMALAAPRIIMMMDRFGCPFNRRETGHLDVRRFGGTLYHRTVFCGASTGQQLLYTLDEQVRRLETLGLVKRYENHEFLRLVRDNAGDAKGVIICHLFNLKLEALKGDAVVVATGGPGLIFGKSTNSTFCTGAANGRLYRQGMHYANGEFIQIHPSAIPGADKFRLMSESLRGEGGRIWVPGDSTKQILFPDGTLRSCGQTGKPWYFLEEMYPAYGNLVARDVGAREILRICEMGLGVEGKMEVYLDVTELSAETHHKLEAVLEIYQKFRGVDPRKVPMKIFPAVHYSMGGAWVDWPSSDDHDREERFRQMTNIPGCFNCGESDFAYHGANRLGANSLLSCIFGGLTTGDEVPKYIASLKQIKETSAQLYEEALAEEEAFKKDLFQREGVENVYKLHEELSHLMIKNVTVIRNNADLSHTLESLKVIRDRYKNISLSDHNTFANRTFQFAHQFRSMLDLALVITKSALLRNESRGAHFKREFPERDDDNFLKTTLASYSEDEPVISYLPVDARHVNPREKRDYTIAKKSIPEFTNIPNNIKLPV